MGMFLRRGEAPKKCTITITSATAAGYAQLKIGDAVYASVQSIVVPAGTEVIFALSGYNTTAERSCYVAVDGTVIAEGSGNHTYVVEQDISVALLKTYNGNADYYGYVSITT